MPYTPTAPPSTRFFAHLERFECECPHCGKLITWPTKRQGLQLSARLIWDKLWNPVTQRLTCPFCRHVYMAGLILHPIPLRQKRPLDAPPDVVPNARERAQMRAQGGGWWSRTTYRRGDHVNVAVETPCSCTPAGGSLGCAVHGDTAQPNSGA